MCSSNVSDTANRLLKRTDSEGSSSVAEKKSSAVPLFRSGHMSAICARLGSKGKVGVQRGRETAGVPSFLPPRRVPHVPAVRRRRIPLLRFSEKLPARQGRTRLRQFASPAQPVLKKGCRPSGTNTPAQFAHPAQPVLKKAAAPSAANPSSLWFSAAKQKHRRPPVRGVLFYSISSRTENAASCSVLSSLYSISREYALQMQICAQCVTSPLASHSYTSSS